MIVAWMMMNAFRGVYQGVMDFKTLGINIGVEGILRAAIGIGLLWLGLGVFGSIGASLVSGVVAVFILIFPFFKKHGEAFLRI